YYGDYPGNKFDNPCCTLGPACARIRPKQNPVRNSIVSCLMWRNDMRLQLTLLIVLLTLSVASFGQGFQGGLRGSVRDTGGAVVPGVEVTLTNEATSLSRKTVTNESGEYSFTALDAGSYRLNASLTGFKAIDLTGIRVGTQQFVTLDLKLEVG